MLFPFYARKIVKRWNCDSFDALSILVYISNRRWRWCRFASSIFKTMRHHMHILEFKQLYRFIKWIILFLILGVINFQCHLYQFNHAFNLMGICIVKRNKVVFNRKSIKLTRLFVHPLSYFESPFLDLWLPLFICKGQIYTLASITAYFA